MARINDINNRIDGHLILSNSEITTDGLTLGFDERMNMNMSKYKRLGIRKIKCELVEDPGYPFALDIRFYDMSTGSLRLHLLNFSMNILVQNPIKIGMEIVDKLNEFIESKGKTPRFSTSKVNDSIYINWDNTSGSSDYFEFRLMNEYTIEHFSFYRGFDNSIPNSRNITKNN
jgi:hypothetical protein